MTRSTYSIFGGALLALSCGASPYRLHQAEVYYERCRAVDLDETRSLDERSRCWIAWLRYYGPDAPPERRLHAHDRTLTLSTDTPSIGAVEASTPLAVDLPASATLNAPSTPAGEFEAESHCARVCSERRAECTLSEASCETEQMHCTRACM